MITCHSYSYLSGAVGGESRAAIEERWATERQPRPSHSNPSSQVLSNYFANVEEAYLLEVLLVPASQVYPRQSPSTPTGRRCPASESYSPPVPSSSKSGDNHNHAVGRVKHTSQPLLLFHHQFLDVRRDVSLRELHLLRNVVGERHDVRQLLARELDLAP